MACAPAASATSAAARPAAPSASCSRNTRASALTGEALQRLAARGVQLGDLAGEVAERDLAERVHELLHVGGRAQVGVLLARVDRGVEVGLALAAAAQQPLL